MEFIDKSVSLSGRVIRRWGLNILTPLKKNGAARMFTFLAAVVGLCLQAAAVQAEEIYILSSRADGAHAALSSELKTRLERSLPPKYIVHEIPPTRSESVLAKAGSRDYIVTVGTQAMTDVLARPLKATLLATLLPKKAYQSILQKDALTKKTTAVFIDQPAARNVDLIGIALPNKSVGVLLSDSRTDLYQSLDRIRKKKDGKLILRSMAPDENLVDALEKVLRDSEVLLAFADPEVSNRNTAQHLLLTTYRRGIPMVAYSRAYVRAGALMAVYSTPEQYAQQAAEMLLASIRSGGVIPSPQYPKYFSVEINQNVAHSLGLNLPSRQEIENRLMAKRQVSGD